jgi:hypothetical protein
MTNSSRSTVSKLRASDGSLVGTLNAVSNVFGIAFDGANMWVVNISANSISEF